MSINFNRNRVQTLYEGFIGINGPDELLPNKDAFKSHILSEHEANQLKLASREDAVDFFYSGILSFSEGIDSVFLGRYSWATIKLYYCVYYFIRATLACKEYSLLRCNGLYRLKIEKNGALSKATGKHNSTTHEGTINYYREVFSGSDKLLSNSIDGYDAYGWLMNAREIVNYRNVTFEEPSWLDIWNVFSDAAQNNTLPSLLSQLELDNFVLCFQEEYAVVGIPIKRAQETISDLSNCGLLQQLLYDKNEFAKTVIGYNTRALTILNSVFGN